MSSFALLDATTWVDSHDFTTDTNKVALNASVDEKDNTTFGGGGWRSRIGGLKTVDASYDGYWQAGAGQVDAEAFTNLGTARTAMSVSPDGDDGSIAYFFQPIDVAYSCFGAIGEVTPFNVRASGRDGKGLIRGRVLFPKQTVAATGAGTTFEISAVGATQFLYAALFVFSAGTTITVQLQSDDNSGMTSAVTRGTFNAVTAAGGYWLTPVAGAITDTFWRANVSAITGSFSIAVVLGIAT